MVEVGKLRSAVMRQIRRKSARSDEIEDVVQDVFLRIAARRHHDALENTGAYYYRAAENVLWDRHRRRKVRHGDDHVPFDCDRHAGCDFDPARILEGRQSLQVAVAAIETLPARTRAVFMLRRLEGRAFREIAAQLGISVSGVEKHMARATGKLSAAAA